MVFREQRELGAQLARDRNAHFERAAQAYRSGAGGAAKSLAQQVRRCPPEPPRVRLRPVAPHRATLWTSGPRPRTHRLQPRSSHTGARRRFRSPAPEASRTHDPSCPAFTHARTPLPPPLSSNPEPSVDQIDLHGLFVVRFSAPTQRACPPPTPPTTLGHPRTVASLAAPAGSIALRTRRWSTCPRSSTRWRWPRGPAAARSPCWCSRAWARIAKAGTTAGACETSIRMRCVQHGTATSVPA